MLTYTGFDYARRLYFKDVYSKSGIYKSWIFYTVVPQRNLYSDLISKCYLSTCFRVLTSSFVIVEYRSLSDNGSQSISSETQNFIAKKGITQKFNLAAKPLWGGLFERFVRSIKRCLKKILKNLRYEYKQLYALLKHIQAVINNGPLTFMYEEPGEDFTPHHLLYGHNNQS